jgi:hypothetical protein
MSSALSTQHWDTSHLNVPTRKVTKQNSLENKEAYVREDACFACKEKGHKIDDCPKEETTKQIC